MKRHFIYILTNRYHNVLYTGSTDNFKQRIYLHKNRYIAGFTRKYNVTKLVYFHECSSKQEARIYEKKLKGWTKEKKHQLIESINPKWNELQVPGDPSQQSCSG